MAHLSWVAKSEFWAPVLYIRALHPFTRSLSKSRNSRLWKICQMLPDSKWLTYLEILSPVQLLEEGAYVFSLLHSSLSNPSLTSWLFWEWSWEQIREQEPLLVYSYLSLLLGSLLNTEYTPVPDSGAQRLPKQSSINLTWSFNSVTTTLELLNSSRETDQNIDFNLCCLAKLWSLSGSAVRQQCISYCLKSSHKG